MKWRNPSNSDVVALGGIDREVPIYRPIPDIVDRALQKARLCERGETILASSAKISVVTLITLGRSLTYNKNRIGDSPH